MDQFKAIKGIKKYERNVKQNHRTINNQLTIDRYLIQRSKSKTLYLNLDLVKCTNYEIIDQKIEGKEKNLH